MSNSGALVEDQQQPLQFTTEQLVQQAVDESAEDHPTRINFGATATTPPDSAHSASLQVQNPQFHGTPLAHRPSPSMPPSTPPDELDPSFSAEEEQLVQQQQHQQHQQPNSDSVIDHVRRNFGPVLSPVIEQLMFNNGWFNYDISSLYLVLQQNAQLCFGTAINKLGMAKVQDAIAKILTSILEYSHQGSTAAVVTGLQKALDLHLLFYAMLDPRFLKTAVEEVQQVQAQQMHHNMKMRQQQQSAAGPPLSSGGSNNGATTPSGPSGSGNATGQSSPSNPTSPSKDMTSPTKKSPTSPAPPLPRSRQHAANSQQSPPGSQGSSPTSSRSLPIPQSRSAAAALQQQQPTSAGSGTGYTPYPSQSTVRQQQQPIQPTSSRAVEADRNHQQNLNEKQIALYATAAATMNNPYHASLSGSFGSQQQAQQQGHYQTPPPQDQTQVKPLGGLSGATVSHSNTNALSPSINAGSGNSMGMPSNSGSMSRADTPISPLVAAFGGMGAKKNSDPQPPAEAAKDDGRKKAGGSSNTTNDKRGAGGRNSSNAQHHHPHHNDDNGGGGVNVQQTLAAALDRRERQREAMASPAKSSGSWAEDDVDAPMLSLDERTKATLKLEMETFLHKNKLSSLSSALERSGFTLQQLRQMHVQEYEAKLKRYVCSSSVRKDLLDAMHPNKNYPKPPPPQPQQPPALQQLMQQSQGGKPPAKPSATAAAATQGSKDTKIKRGGNRHDDPDGYYYSDDNDDPRFSHNKNSGGGVPAPRSKQDSRQSKQRKHNHADPVVEDEFIVFNLQASDSRGSNLSLSSLMAAIERQCGVPDARVVNITWNAAGTRATVEMDIAQFDPKRALQLCREREFKCSGLFFRAPAASSSAVSAGGGHPPGRSGSNDNSNAPPPPVASAEKKAHGSDNANYNRNGPRKDGGGGGGGAVSGTNKNDRRRQPRGAHNDRSDESGDDDYHQQSGGGSRRPQQQQKSSRTPPNTRTPPLTPGQHPQAAAAIPAQQSLQQQQPPSLERSSERCRFYSLPGGCRRGDACMFSHDGAPSNHHSGSGGGRGGGGGHHHNNYHGANPSSSAPSHAAAHHSGGGRGGGGRRRGGHHGSSGEQN